MSFFKSIFTRDAMIFQGYQAGAAATCPFNPGSYYVDAWKRGQALARARRASFRFTSAKKDREEDAEHFWTEILTALSEAGLPITAQELTNRSTSDAADIILRAIANSSQESNTWTKQQQRNSTP